MVVIMQHPGEEPYMEASQMDSGRATLIDAPLAEEARTVETLIKGIVEDVLDSDSDGEDKCGLNMKVRMVIMGCPMV